MQVHVGSRVEIDVATLHNDRDEQEDPQRTNSGEGGVALLRARPWTPPAPGMSMPAIYPNSIEVLVYSTEGGATVIAAVELVSPANKDRHQTRRAFAAKCASYLQQGIGLIVMNVVTDRTANLHNELVDLLEIGSRYQVADADVYAAAYRPIRQANSERTDVWISSLEVGKPLPLLPLALDKGICIPLDFEPPYMEACQRSRLI